WLPLVSHEQRRSRRFNFQQLLGHPRGRSRDGYLLAFKAVADRFTADDMLTFGEVFKREFSSFVCLNRPIRTIYPEPHTRKALASGAVHDHTSERGGGGGRGSCREQKTDADTTNGGECGCVRVHACNCSDPRRSGQSTIVKSWPKNVRTSDAGFTILCRSARGRRCTIRRDNASRPPRRRRCRVLRA